MLTEGVHGETPLNIDLGINSERQDWKIGTVGWGILVGWGRVNGGDEGEGMQLMDFIYLYEIEQ
jgi:hypothetical protein